MAGGRLVHVKAAWTQNLHLPFDTLINLGVQIHWSSEVLNYQRGCMADFPV